MPYNYYRQLRTVLLLELSLLTLGIFGAVSLWDGLCDSSLIACLRDESLSIPGFLFLSLIRPFVLTPVPIFALMAGNSYGSWMGAVLTAASAVLSCFGVYLFATILGKRLVTPWIRWNLPQTLRFLRSQDWKIILLVRLIPVLPFDVMTFLFGLLGFRLHWIIVFTFLGVLPEAYIFSQLADPESTPMYTTVMTVSVFCCFFLLPGAIIEFISRKRGSGMWMRLKAMWHELHTEITLNNSIVKRREHDPRKRPVLLLYGFFSSRRSLTVLERILTFRGYEVFSFNMGGLLGVFFTKGIVESARFVDFKLKRQFERHNFQEIDIIAHSKGGLVAMWWLLKMGGHIHCKRLITMGTPFKGSRLTWLGLVTPVGLMFRDIWQMRPGSLLLKELHECPVPRNLRIYNLYSNRDKVATGDSGVFVPPEESADTVVPIPLHHLSHFEFLYRRDVGDTLARLLGSPYRENEGEEAS